MPVHDTPPPRVPTRPAPVDNAKPTAAQRGVATMLGHHAPTDQPTHGAPVAPRGVVNAALNRVHQADQRAQALPAWMRTPAHEQAYTQNILPLATAYNLGDLTTRLLRMLPSEDRAQVASRLPGVSRGDVQTLGELQNFAQPHDAISRAAHNFMPDMLGTPQGIVLGGLGVENALLHLAGGDYKPAVQVGGAMVSPLMHPGQLVEQHPFQALISLSGIGRAAGAVAGGAARTGALGSRLAEAASGNAPRALVSREPVATRLGADGEVQNVNRVLDLGHYDRNLAVQGVQRLRDRAATATTGRFDNLVEQQLGQIQRRSNTMRLAQNRRDIAPVVQQLRKTKGSEQTAAWAFHQGVSPQALADHFTSETQRLANATSGNQLRSLRYAQAQAKRWTKIAAKHPEPTPATQALSSTAHQAIAPREQLLRDRGLETLQQQQDRTLLPSRVLGTEPIGTPGYIPHTGAGGRRIPIGPRRAGNNPGLAQSQMHNEGINFRTGNVDTTWNPFLRALAQPHNALARIQQLEQIRNTLGREVRANDHFDPQREVLMRATTQPGQTLDELIRNNFETFDEKPHHEIGVVPSGSWIAIPRQALEQVRTGVAKLTRGEQRLYTATNAFRWANLFTKPAWLTGNLASNHLLAALSGVGPVSLYRAIDKTQGIGRYLPGRDYGGVVPDNVQGGGFITNQLAPKSGMAHIGGHSPLNIIRDANVTNENYLRRAIYLRHALPKYGHDMDALMAAKTAEERAPLVTQMVDRFLGDFHGHGGKGQLTVPFLRWLTFITDHTLRQLPLHHPARALLLYRLGTLGNLMTQQEQGLADPANQGAVPLFGGGKGPEGPTSFLLRTGGLNPWATVSNLAGFDPTQPDAQPRFGGVVSSLNPFLQMAYAAGTGHDLSNPSITALHNMAPNARAQFLLGQLLNLAPQYRYAFGASRMGVGQRSGLIPPQPTPPWWARLLSYAVAPTAQVDERLQNEKNLYYYERNATRRH